MQENIITEENNNSFQILITGITWNRETTKLYHTKSDDKIELPTQFAYDVPESVLNQANKPENVFNDIIETHVYNFLTKKFGHEVYSCSIWLPLKEETAA